jgi:hypothetical protein
MEVSAEQEIKQVAVGKPHVLILGAGASYAAFPNGGEHYPFVTPVGALDPTL